MESEGTQRAAAYMDALLFSFFPEDAVVADASQRQDAVASVLIIARDPNIESLLGQLVEGVGHRPLNDVTRGAAGESIRRTRPDVALIDAALPPAVVKACVGAAEEVGASPVLTSDVDSATELAEEARGTRYPYLPLPGGLKPLAEVIERILAARSTPPPIAI